MRGEHVLRGVVSSARPFHGRHPAPTEGWHRFQVAVLPLTNPPITFTLRAHSTKGACPKLGDPFDITFTPTTETTR